MIRRPPRSTLFPTRRSSDLQASGIRVGTPAVTTRGMEEAEMAAIADMISEVLMDIKNLDAAQDRKSTRLNSSHSQISYAVFCLKKKKTRQKTYIRIPNRPNI